MTTTPQSRSGRGNLAATAGATEMSTVAKGPAEAPWPAPAGPQRRNPRYFKRRQILINSGQWQPNMDAAPVRAHLRRLMAKGFSRDAIACLTGVPASTIDNLLYGAPIIGRPPTTRISVDTGRALLAAAPTLDDYPARALVDATGTRRRLQALAALGWPVREVAARVGMSRINLWQDMQRARVLAGTARSVRDVYNELWDESPPRGTRAERISVAKTLAHARARGWPSPLAWDDDTIDDPAAKPRGVSNA